MGPARVWVGAADDVRIGMSFSVSLRIAWSLPCEVSVDRLATLPGRLVCELLGRSPFATAV
jgi:hypothetical protein